MGLLYKKLLNDYLIELQNFGILDNGWFWNKKHIKNLKEVNLTFSKSLTAIKEKDITSSNSIQAVLNGINNLNMVLTEGTDMTFKYSASEKEQEHEKDKINNAIIKIKEEIEKIIKQANNKYSIEPLSKETLDESIRLIKKVFPKQGLEPASFELKCSLGITPYVLITRIFLKMEFIKYWVILYDGNVAGVLGVLTYTWDKEAIWGTWLCVEPDLKKIIPNGDLIYKRTGGLLLKRVIDEGKFLAKEKNRAYLRLYTTTDPLENDANIIYEKLGLKVYKTEKEPPIMGNGYTRIYRQVKIEDINT